MSSFYVYKVVHEGVAPFIDKGLLTLAICKPQIRRQAKKGDFVLGFAANSMSRDNALIYVAQVSENLEDGQYYKDERYAGRRDRIYEFKGGAFRFRGDAQVHTDDKEYHLRHDLGEGGSRPNVLTSTRFRYFWAGNASADYKGKYCDVAELVADLGRGHRVNYSFELREQLRTLCESMLASGPMVVGNAPKDVIGSCRVQDTADEGAALAAVCLG